MGDDALRRLKEAQALMDALFNKEFEEDLLRSMLEPVEDDGTPCCKLHGMLHHHWKRDEDDDDQG